MKFNIPLLFASLLLVSCNHTTEKEIISKTTTTVTETPLLKDHEGWVVNKLDEGVVHYQFPSQYIKEFDSYQNVNAFSIHPSNTDYEMQFLEINPRDSLSSALSSIPNAVFGINGTYYEKNKNNNRSTSFFRTDGVLIDSVQINKGDAYYWKHEGAFYLSPDNVGIVRGNNQVYNQPQYHNIMSGSPLLIENYHPSGSHYVRHHLGNLNQLDYEHPDRHQGVRHPRTAVAIMEDKTILFIAVDGRSEKAAGMTAKELTNFIANYFNPKDALNLDGGGSTTFWMQRDIDNISETGVINYPTDNRAFDHYGQRRIRNGFVVVKK